MTLQGIRYAVRSLIFDRGVSAIVIACLALGIGVNATLFSVVDGILIQPLPYAEADRLLILTETFERGGIRDAGVAYQSLRDWKARATSFTTIAALRGISISLSDTVEPERLEGAAITWDLFPMLGVPPALGRHFVEEDDRPGAEPVLILSHEVWQRRYQGDAGIIGRSISVNGRPHTVVAVMPPKFRFPENQTAWIPIGPISDNEPRSNRSQMAIRPPETRRRAGAGTIGAGVDCGRARQRAPRHQRGLERNGSAVVGRVHPR